MKTYYKTFILATAVSALAFAGVTSTAVADPFENYFAGKTVTISIRSTPGGGYDTHGRLLARHLGNHLPGKPNVRAVNRPGAGGIVSANYLYNQAPRDGTEILIAARELALAERIGQEGVNYRSLEMPSLGSPVSDNRVWVAGPNSTVRNLDDLMKFNGNFRFAVSGLGAGSAQMVDLLGTAGYPVSNVTGFEGTGDQILSVLRGEVQGMNGTYPAQKSIIEDEKLVIFAKLGNHPDLREIDDVRNILEGDFRILANIFAAPLLAGRPFFTTPGTPPEVLAILRKGFYDTIHSEAYNRDLAQMGEELSFTTPEEIEESFRATLEAPDHIIQLFTN